MDVTTSTARAIFIGSSFTLQFIPVSRYDVVLPEDNRPR